MGILLLGEIESSLLQGYFGELRTKEVVVTEERMEHIRERHPEDVELFVLYGKEVVLKPDILLVDEKHIGTVFAIKRLPETNLNVVIRLVMETDRPDRKNSVMTFYRIRERNLKKLMEKNRLLYSRE